MRPLILFIPAFTTLALVSCGEPAPSTLPVISTPSGAKVNLSKVSMVVSNPKITRVSENKYTLNFDYTLNNQAGAHITFPCLHNVTDDLIEINLHDSGQQALVLGKRPLEGLTLTQPRPLRIPSGETTRHFTVPLMPELREKGDPISLRVRLHAPSRYDELRSSIEAPRLQIFWP